MFRITLCSAAKAQNKLAVNGAVRSTAQLHSVPHCLCLQQLSLDRTLAGTCRGKELTHGAFHRVRMLIVQLVRRARHRYHLPIAYFSLEACDLRRFEVLLRYQVSLCHGAVLFIESGRVRKEIF